MKLLFRKRKGKRSKRKGWRRPVEENVEMYVNLLRSDTDDIIIPIGKFYRDCRWEYDGREDGEMVIMGLQKYGYEVRFVVRKGIWARTYVKISR